MLKPVRKILLILIVMICSYLTLMGIIHYSKILAETESEATTFPSKSQ